ncbi:hypothetical protein [Phaeobacter porticola]|uniref:Uncharacterized protein n=1 Tax=Phaeobacter porticola TaxID=1844006 RepID=A0A1L3IA81_9RHOB|nr:hypothetical protein [Phaeobacter porticola]APG48984.1 hypothetical protein PhaeoP97_03632 [Phaeobacter porticola]
MLRSILYLSLIASTPLIAICASLPMISKVDALPSALFVTIPKSQPRPELEIFAEFAPSDGWWLRIEVKNFAFTELCVSKANATALGHAHVHLGLQKIATAYHPDVFIGHLPAGSHQITVSLRAQDHRVLASPSGGMFSKSLTLQIP